MRCWLFSRPCSCRPKLAQSTAPAASKKEVVGFHGWEIEGRVGTIGGSTPTGTGVLPPAGQGFTTAPGNTSRFVTSWYFGNGALFANQVPAALTASSPVGAVFPRISPLDPVLTSAGATMQRGGMLGLRAGHSITQWVLDSLVGRASATSFTVGYFLHF